MDDEHDRQGRSTALKEYLNMRSFWHFFQPVEKARSEEVRVCNIHCPTERVTLDGSI